VLKEHKVFKEQLVHKDLKELKVLKVSRVHKEFRVM
jgi:hypothetical protein